MKMGKISVNDGFYMMMIACDRIISKETVVTYNTNLIYKSLLARIRSDNTDSLHHKFNQVTFMLM